VKRKSAGVGGKTALPRGRKTRGRNGTRKEPAANEGNARDEEGLRGVLRSDSAGWTVRKRVKLQQFGIFSCYIAVKIAVFMYFCSLKGRRGLFLRHTDCFSITHTITNIASRSECPSECVAWRGGQAGMSPLSKGMGRRMAVKAARQRPRNRGIAFGLRNADCNSKHGCRQRAERYQRLRAVGL